jgi:hypothetical protein
MNQALAQPAAHAASGRSRDDMLQAPAEIDGERSMARVARAIHALRLLPAAAVLQLLLLGHASAAGADKRMTDYFNCINYYVDPALREMAAARGSLTDGVILAEIAKAERYCQKQVSAAVQAVRDAPDNGTQKLTDEQIRTQLRDMTAAGYVMTYGQQ